MGVEKENFASRWSRRKQAVAQEKSELDVSVVDDSVIESPPIDEATLAEQRLAKLNDLTDEDMPDLDTLNEGSDFSGFMSTGVSETLRKMALQKLFHGKSYNIRDGLDEYDGDYTKFAKLDPSVITCDMQHMIEVEAKKLLAEQEKEAEEERLALVANDSDVETVDKGTEKLPENTDTLALEDSQSKNERVMAQTTVAAESDVIPKIESHPRKMIINNEDVA